MAANISKQDVVDYISNMTVLELSEFVKELEQKFGVTAAAPSHDGQATAQAAEAAQEKEFDVICIFRRQENPSH
jgi:large subunit ribosomal protein L7/L12